jgi:hypothetical protein
MRNINKVIDKVYNDLLSMSDDEFQLELSKHRNGDISKILLESGAIKFLSGENDDQINK